MKTESKRVLFRQGIRLTVDLIYGLPGQLRVDVEESLRWAWKFRPAHTLSHGLKPQRPFWKNIFIECNLE